MASDTKQSKENNTFIFQTGHGKGLARAELAARFGENGILDEVQDGFVVQAELNDAKATLNTLGGIVRITQVLHKGPARMKLNFEDWVVKSLEKLMDGMEGKKRFGLSIHPKSEKILKSSLIGAKKKLKSSLGNIRFVNKDFQNLSSVQAWHENLLGDRAVELHLFKSDTHWYLTRTLAIQNFEWYSKRDYERPARSAKNGMFPPKLAQMLINIATKGAPNPVIYDPFCGSGTVLQEAWLMGYATAGSDLSENMVQDSKANLKWLQKEAAALPQPFPHLFTKDATQLSAEDLPDSPFTIVTETYLGPPLSSPPSPLERPKLQREIEQLYEAFFANLKSVVKTPTTMIFTAAYYKDKNERYFLPKLPEILAKHTEVLPLSTHKRPSLFYERKQQIVGREIWKVRIHP